MFLEGVEVRQQALDEARTQLAEVETPATRTDELPDGDLLRASPTLTAQEWRRLMNGLLGSSPARTRTSGEGGLCVAQGRSTGS